jgi:formylglycine-generating enzyme required for sulfatase activity
MKLALDAWQELPEGTIHTIPVRIDDCDVPESFWRYHWTNLFEPNGFDRIVRASRAELAKRPKTALPLILQPQPSTNPSEEPTTSNSALEPTFTNSVGMEFVLIPKGTFMMGSPDSDTETLSNERPAHRVTITQPFYLGKYPVSQAQWQAVMGNNPSRYTTDPHCPVTNVSWHDVHVFLHTLNERAGNGDYRLPTEAQWEYACRAGTTSPRYHPDLNALAWYRTNNEGLPQPVGQKLPKARGLYDMLGNVWEWCHDGGRQYRADAAVNPIGPTDADAHRVFRGGSWGNPTRDMRAAFRNWTRPVNRCDDLGFRCVSSGKRR